jgi:hypothetical protein
MVTSVAVSRVLITASGSATPSFAPGATRRYFCQRTSLAVCDRRSFATTLSTRVSFHARGSVSRTIAATSSIAGVRPIASLNSPYKTGAASQERTPPRSTTSRNALISFCRLCSRSCSASAGELRGGNRALDPPPLCRTRLGAVVEGLCGRSLSLPEHVSTRMVARGVFITVL